MLNRTKQLATKVEALEGRVDFLCGDMDETIKHITHRELSDFICSLHKTITDLENGYDKKLTDLKNEYDKRFASLKEEYNGRLDVMDRARVELAKEVQELRKILKPIEGYSIAIADLKKLASVEGKEGGTEKLEKAIEKAGKKTTSKKTKAKKVVDKKAKKE